MRPCGHAANDMNDMWNATEADMRALQQKRDVGPGGGNVAELGAVAGERVDDAVQVVRLGAGEDGRGPGEDLLGAAVVDPQLRRPAGSELAELTPFTDRSGINKTLCRALSRLGGTDNDHAFEVRFSWAGAVPSEAPPDTVRFDSVHVAMLRHAAEDLGRKPYREEAQMVGHIRHMERHHLNGPGWIVVHGHITTTTARRPRQAWVQLRPGDYEQTLAAHAQDRPVRIAGVLTRTGHRTEFIDPAVFDA